MSNHFVRGALSNVFLLDPLYLVVDAYYVREERNTSENRGDGFGFWIPGQLFFRERVNAWRTNRWRSSNL